MTKFTVATWNVGHAFRGHGFRVDAQKAYLEDHVKPDVALLQEVDELDYPHVVGPGEGAGANPRSAIVSWDIPLDGITEVHSRYAKKGASPVSLHRTFPGSLAVASAEVAGTNVVFVSLYGVFDHGYTVTTVHKQLSDLAPLLDSKLGRNMILGGDLNCSTQVDPPHRAWHHNLFERFDSLGLVNLLDLTADRRPALNSCWCDDEPCRHVQTHRHRTSEKPWHNDYLFATKSLAERVADCYVVDSGEPDPWSLSDHCPVVAEFDPS